MANTYYLLGSSTVGSGGATQITFSSIPNTYTDLVVKLSGRTDRSGTFDDYAVISFNGVTTNLSSRFLFAVNSGTIGSSTDTAVYGPMNAANATSSAFGTTEFYIPNYASSLYKSISIDASTESNATDAIRYLVAGLWSSSSAITQIKLNPYYGPNFVQYTTAYLYGIKNS